MRETCTSGSVRGGDGDIPTYSAGDIRQRFEILRELGGVVQSCEFAVKRQAAGVERRSQMFEKQATIAA